MSSRIELRPDTYRVPVDNGLYILGNAGPVSLTGASIAQWVDRLAPYLDGRHSLDDLTQALAPERRQLVERVITALQARDVVRERSEQEPSPLEAADAARYAPEIAYLDYFRDSAAAVFARYRATTALAIGSGALLLAVVQAALRSGLRTVRVAPVQPASLDELARVDHRYPELRVDPYPGDDVEQLTGLISGTDLVLQVGDELPWTQTRLLERCCARAGAALLQAMVRDGEAWLVAGAGVDAPHWASAQPRLRPPAPPSGTEPLQGAVHGAVATTAVASRLVQAAFRALTGVGATPVGELVRLDLGMLRSDRHRFLPHPFAVAAQPASRAGFRTRIAELMSDPGLTEEEFSRQAAACVDDRLGIVTLHEHDWAQSPLHVTEARIYDPVGLLGTGQPARTSRAGVTHQAARCAATMRGLARYGALMVDPRRLVDPAGRPLAARSADPYQTLVALRHGSIVGAAWGYEITDLDRVRLVPATVAFPRLRTSVPQAASTAGLAAGLDWHDAVLSGLLGHCRRLTLDEIGQRTTGPYPTVDLAATALDQPGERCRNLLAALGEQPEVYAVTGSLGVPTYAFCSGSGTLAYTTASSGPSAVSLGLMHVLHAVQARAHQRPAMLPPAVPDLPRSLRGRHRTSVDAVTSWGVAGIAARLRSTGRVAIAVPLDHDPQLAAIMPYLVQVVICDD